MLCPARVLSETPRLVSTPHVLERNRCAETTHLRVRLQSGEHTSIVILFRPRNRGSDHQGDTDTMSTMPSTRAFATAAVLAVGFVAYPSADH